VSDLFDRVSDVLPGMVPEDLGDFMHRAHGSGIKVWWSDDGREHFEAQLVRAAEYDGPVLEIGFHAEHGDADRNDAVLASLTPRRGWASVLGKQVQAGRFLGGRSRPWRRVSEIWRDVDLHAEDLPIEIADRLVAYIEAIEPARRARE
jgi:hypothetical protein